MKDEEFKAARLRLARLAKERRISRLRAKRLLGLHPGAKPLDDAALVVENGQISFAGSFSEAKRTQPGEFEDLGELTLMPGPINSHCHLELSHLRGQAPQGEGFTAWVGWLIRQPLENLDGASLSRAIGELEACGTAGLADIGSRAQARILTALRGSQLAHLVFYEFFGWARPESLAWPKSLDSPASLPGLAAAGHALYSTSPELLGLAKAHDQALGLAFSLHLAEHSGEMELLATGQGEFAALLSKRVLPKNYQAPGISPVALASRLGLLDARTLAVHCVHLSPADIETLKQSGCTVCLCPRSNAYIGGGRAPAGKLIAAGVKLCLGTDSLASNQDLDLFNEARALLGMLDNPPGLAWLVETLSLNPARLFGFSGLCGLEPGKLARITVLPPDLCELEA